MERSGQECWREGRVCTHSLQAAKAWQLFRMLHDPRCPESFQCLLYVDIWLPSSRPAWMVACMGMLRMQRYARILQCVTEIPLPHTWCRNALNMHAG